MASPYRLRIATRESRLALWQANHVAELLKAQYPACAVALLGMTTRGDQIQDRPLSDIGGKGLFTKELELALLDGRARARGAFAQGRADGSAGCVRARLRARAGGPARRLRLQPPCRPRAAAGRGGGRHLQSSARSPIARALSGAAHRAAARQPRHPAGQARRRPVRRDHPRAPPGSSASGSPNASAR